MLFSLTIYWIELTTYLNCVNHIYCFRNLCVKIWFIYVFMCEFYLISFLTRQFVAATQPINSLAFVFDGVNYGASDFAYSAYSLVNLHPFFNLFIIFYPLCQHLYSNLLMLFYQVMVSLASVTSLFFLYKSKGFIGIWIALTIYMSLRMIAGIWRSVKSSKKLFHFQILPNVSFLTVVH